MAQPARATRIRSITPMTAESARRAQILAAARHLFSSQGVAATTMDSVAEGAGCSRMTVYRHFPGKEALLRAAVVDDLDKAVAQFDAIWHATDSLEDRVVAAFVWSVQSARANPILSQLLKSEPESLLLALTLGGESLLATTSSLVAERFRDERMDDENATILAEMLTRLVLSMLLQPYGALRLERREDLEEFARYWIAPSVRLTLSSADAGAVHG